MHLINFYFKLNTMNYRVNIIFLMAMLAVSSGCINEDIPPENIVARVMDVMLSTSEVSAWEASLPHPPSQEARTNYIRHWVDEELLYQEAIKNDLLNDPWVAERVDELVRSLAIARYMEKDIMKMTRPTPTQVKEYYQMHSSEFVWENLHLVIDYWRCETHGGMDKLRANLLRGNNNSIWTGTPNGLEHSRITINGKDDTDPKLWKTVSKLKVGQVSTVQNILSAYWILKLADRFEKGDPKSIDEVQQEISARLMEESIRNRKDAIIQKLIDEYSRDGRLQWTDISLPVTIIDPTGTP